MPTIDIHRTITCKKHWIAFLYPIMMMIPAILLLFVKWKLIQVMGAMWIMANLFRIGWLLSVKWTLTSTSLYIKKGFIPGTRSTTIIHMEDIYQSLVSFLLFSPYFNCGHLTISRVQQLGKVIHGRSLKSAREMSAEINLRVWNNKMKNQLKVPVLHSGNTMESLLKQLSALKASGDISPEDYEMIVKKIQPAIAS